MTESVSIVGYKTGKLTVLARDGSTSYGQSKWLCQCECGSEKSIAWATLKRGVGSCGCLWRRHFAETRICSSCKEEKKHSEFSRGNSGAGLNGYCKPCVSKKTLAKYHANPAPVRARLKRSRDAMRAEVLEKYGNACVCCGEKEKIFLAIDHKENNGGSHRRKVGRGDQFYRWLKNRDFPPEFQILCCNCNWGKYINGGTCPHKSNAALG